jgi:outer membrane protein assembly factor BamB
MYRLTFGLLLCCSITLHGDEPSWNQWRGPQRDGVVGKSDFVWPKKLELESIWKLEKLGPSYSGPLIVGDRVYTTETVDKKYELVKCLDRKTGKELWNKQWDGSMTVPFFAARNGSWIRATPAVDSDAIYIGGIRDLLVCLEAKDGSERWRIDFPKELKSPLPDFGFASSPLIDDTAVYVQSGGGFVKVDKKTGKILWHVLKDGGGTMGSAFSSPIFAKINGIDQIVVQTRTKLVGVTANDGKELWSKEIPSFRGMNILTPTIFKDGVFTSTYGGNTRMVKLEKQNDSLTPTDAWGFKYEAYMSSPIVIDGHAYLHGKDRKFICVDLATGKETWRSEKGYGEYWSMVAQGDKMLALDQTGKLMLIQANPKELEILAEKEVSPNETWAHLAVVGDELYIRDLYGLTAWRWKK